MDRLPAGSKVVVWTATVHAARQQGVLPRQPLGVSLATRYGRQLAVVGFTALGGQSSMAGRPMQPLPQLPSGSLEASALPGDVTWALLGKSALRSLGRTPSRLLGPISAAVWSDYFDYVVVVKEEVAPVFEKWR
jgi:erythromycin esterase-like protein